MPISHKHAGFTIVELLIVIVVIGILATITLVSYNGIAKRAVTTGLEMDVGAMDKAQKQYMALYEDMPITYDSDGTPNTTLAFAASKGNSLIVTLKEGDQYCIYGYNPASSYPTLNHALVRSSNNTPCASLGAAPPTGGVQSTVSIIGQRLEQYLTQYGKYPGVSSLVDIGLIIKSNSGNANQQQLYCRNNTKAIYLQVNPADGKIYVYDTATHSISEPTDLDKLSLNSTCPKFGISPTDPGYESTGVKNTNI